MEISLLVERLTDVVIFSYQSVDFEQPRALWQKVFSDVDRDHLVGNVAVHLKNAKSAEVKARQRTSISPVRWNATCHG